METEYNTDSGPAYFIQTVLYFFRFISRRENL